MKLEKKKIIKKPDQIVWDPESQTYNAFLLPYGTSVSAPSITLDDVKVFKERKVNKVQKIFTSKYNELVEDYKNLLDEVKLNELIYNSKFSFEPVVGEIYHLYVGNDGNYFLSLISPNEWDREHITSVFLNSDHKWVLQKDL